jgi:hypothetical protein
VSIFGGSGFKNHISTGGVCRAESAYTLCADGSALDPAVIVERKGTLCSSWVHDVEPGKYQVHSRQVRQDGLTLMSAWPVLNKFLTGARRRKRGEVGASLSSTAIAATPPEISGIIAWLIKSSLSSYSLSQPTRCNHLMWSCSRLLVGYTC